MPICPDCRSSELVQSVDPEFMTCTVCKAKFKLLTVVETINDIPSMSSCSKIPMASWYVCKKCGKGFNKYTLEQCPYCHTPVEK